MSITSMHHCAQMLKKNNMEGILTYIGCGSGAAASVIADQNKNLMVYGKLLYIIMSKKYIIIFRQCRILKLF